MIRAIDVIDRFTPSCHPAYRAAFENGDDLLQSAGITTPPRLAHFMAQVLHETGGLTILVESGRYSASALARMWDGGNWHRYFANRDVCLAMSKQCAIDRGEALFNLVYGKRLGNGAAETGDGWNYRGRGLMQTTGRDNYRRYGKLAKVDFEGSPDLVISPEHALKPAIAEWVEDNLNDAADRDDIVTITKRINGGTIGLESRKGWYLRIAQFLHGKQLGGKSLQWRVQEALARLGYSYVHPDGDVGLRTKTAILDFRLRNGLNPVSDVDDGLTAKLGL